MIHGHVVHIHHPCGFQHDHVSLSFKNLEERKKLEKKKPWRLEFAEEMYSNKFLQDHILFSSQPAI
jgi:hypothetical protein